MIDTCKYCGSQNLKFEKTDNLIHYGKMICGHCSHFLYWVSNPNKEESIRKSNKCVQDIIKFHDFDTEFCFMCSRTKEELGIKETFEVEHIHELQDGGKDSIQNMQVLCSACHKIRRQSKR